MANHGISTGNKAANLKVLYGEGDTDVLTSHATSMQKAGHQVQMAEGRKGVLEALKQGTFDLVILGPTLTRDDRHHLPYMVKKTHKTTQVLVLHADGGRHPYVDANLDTGSSMEHVLAKISAIASGEVSEAAPLKEGKSRAAAAGGR
jgi:DNA-binding response OmpR family regulator